jgi:two-component system chemotaxis response regulator CheY
MSFHEEKKKRTENRILIADDDAFIRGLVKKGLTGVGETVETDNGGDVLELYKQHLPDVVLLDIHLPQKKGFDILKELLQYDQSAFVVMLSSDAVKDNVLNCIQYGAKGFIGKPFVRDVLIKYVTMCDTVSMNNSSVMINGSAPKETLDQAEASTAV